MGDDTLVNGLAALSIAFLSSSLMGWNGPVKAMIFSICLVLYVKFGPEAAIYGAFLLLPVVLVARVVQSVIDVAVPWWNEKPKR